MGTEWIGVLFALLPHAAVFCVYRTLPSRLSLLVALGLAIALSAEEYASYDPDSEASRLAVVMMTGGPMLVTAGLGYFWRRDAEGRSARGLFLICFLVGPLSVFPLFLAMVATGQVWGM